MFKRIMRSLGFVPAGTQRMIRARYDAAQTTDENRRHWANVDHLSADSGMTPEVRRTLRARARYECANNSYARGMAETLANYIVGTGPRLQILEGSDEARDQIERAFHAYLRASGFTERLWLMEMAIPESGEAFAVLATNPVIANPVKLQMNLVECDRVTAPSMLPIPERFIDGISFDAFGNPISYTVLKRHPGDMLATLQAATGDFDVYDARDVIHLFRRTRPGQSRGIPSFTPALPLFAILRRYTIAVLGTAEQAALPSGVVYTDAPAADDAPAISGSMEALEINRGEWLQLPNQYKLEQVKAEQPTTQYPAFKSAVLQEICRCLHIPHNIAVGSSAGMNYSSGQLDYGAWHKFITIERAHLSEHVVDRVFRAWLEEAVLVEGLLPQEARSADYWPEHRWDWDALEPGDPVKAATAQQMLLSSNVTTLADECAKHKKDWRKVIEQRGAECALMRQLGVPFETAGAPAPAANSAAVSQTEEPEEVSYAA